ncbi:MAG: hypothetical protein JW751_15210, partial [Polyangiaceae bacterium]|nr:hypothetical protein [Polyangiaceae bacterium]
VGGGGTGVGGGGTGGLTGGTGGSSATGGGGADDTGGSNATGGGDTGGTGGGGEPPEGYPEFPGAGCDAPHGEYGAVDNPKLPNPFQMHNGDIISTRAEWECRRAQIIHDLEEFEVGPKPPPPQVRVTLTGKSLSVQVTTDAGTMTLTSNITGSGSCVAIGVDGPSSMISGCTNVPFSANQVAMEAMTGDAKQSDGYYQVYPELWEPAGDGNAAVGNYSAWSWGVSRLIDGLDQVKDELGIDMTKIGIHGCSWAGKLALWAGALDARIALTVAQESGGGGAAAWRVSDDYETATGSEVEDIDNTGWSWFLDWLLDPYVASGGGGKNPHLLPHDHHELVALIAPRALILLPGNPGNTHLAPHSAYASFKAAKRVWTALGVEDHAGVVGHDQGGAHCSASSSQSQAVNAFVTRFLKDGGGDTTFDKGVDYNGDSYVDWETPTLQ